MIDLEMGGGRLFVQVTVEASHQICRATLGSNEVFDLYGAAFREGRVDVTGGVVTDGATVWAIGV